MAGLGSQLRAIIDAFDGAVTSTERGTCYEHLACTFLEGIPGVTVTARRVLNTAGSQEIDLAAVNRQLKTGLPFLPWFLLAEAKGWNHPVGSNEIAWFATKLQNRSISHGFLFASHGITGDPDELTAAQHQLAASLQNGRHIIVITRDDLYSTNNRSDAITLIERRITQLLVGRLEM